MIINTVARIIIFTAIIIFSIGLAGQSLEKNINENKEVEKNINENKEVEKTEKQWKQELTDEEYRVLRQCGTEPAFTGKYYNHKEDGTYTCAACGAKLFRSDTKYDSGSGWPSFYAAIDKKAIKQVEDNSFGMYRIEIKCANCNSHLGHVFPDGPKPTGQRFCVNSVSLGFNKDDISD